ncbi:unnamed protein product [Calicophoron daubneyi]|uniref:Rab-GAP TBC domain-containing protein n=1 Tax=Calicophoron daubneyi TaxID=300641 RepID=A0AAV2TTR6_CALDB
MSGGFNDQLRQWKNVYVTHIVNTQDCQSVALKGTLFLTEHDARIMIYWVPDPDADDSALPSLRKGYEINVKELHHLTCRRLPGPYCRALYLVLRNSNSYGPFEFRTGGATEFINTLNEFAEVTRSNDDKTFYHVKMRPEPVTSLYQLPPGSGLQGQRNGATNNPMSPFVGVGASLRRGGQAVFNAFIDNILSPSQGVVVGERCDEDSYTNACASQHSSVFKGTIETERLRTTDEADFAVVDVRPPPVALPPLKPMQRGEPLNTEQWKRHLDPCGRVTCVEKLRQIIFEGGVEPNLRPVVWKYLLGYYQWDYTAEENERVRMAKHREYQMLKKFWKQMSTDRLVRFSLFIDRKRYIEKDVPRTDRKTSFFRDDSNGNLTRLYDILLTYTVYNMDFGYYQGMNDLLALILYVIQQEEDAFWCFAGLMERLESNFDQNLNAVREQFYQLFDLIDVLDPGFSDFLASKNAKEMPFCFRWLLIQFKREFSYSDVLMLWETIWSEHLTKNFHIFFAAAVLLMQRNLFIERNYDANNILKHVNDLSYRIPLEPALNTATAYLRQVDEVLNSLPESVRLIVEGPSLATSKHCTKKKSDDRSGDNSSNIEYTWGLLNEELEDLMATDAPEEDVDPSSVTMIPVPTSGPDSDKSGVSVRTTAIVTQPL